jgi:hypothetical protein
MRSGIRFLKGYFQIRTVFFFQKHDDRGTPPPQPQVHLKRVFPKTLRPPSPPTPGVPTHNRLSNKLPVVEICVKNVFRRNVLQVISGHQGGPSGQESSPHPESSVSHDRVVGLTQQCQIDP